MENLLVILDTNFLMIPEEHGVDIFSEIKRILDKEYELIVPEAVVKELKRLKKEGTASERKSAKIALELSEKTRKIESQNQADKEIVRLAKEKECVVGTNDSRLKKHLRKLGTPVIYLRQRSHLEIDGMIN